MSRLRLFLIILQSIWTLTYCSPFSVDAIPKIQLWHKFELQESGPKENKTTNPFEDYEFGANFTLKSLSFHVYGFYDGNGIYRVRFMPNTVGMYDFMIKNQHSIIRMINYYQVFGIM